MSGIEVGTDKNGGFTGFISRERFFLQLNPDKFTCKLSHMNGLCLFNWFVMCFLSILRGYQNGFCADFAQFYWVFMGFSFWCEKKVRKGLPEFYLCVLSPALFETKRAEKPAESSGKLF